ncbi:MAG TPA: peroxidase-related enzyme [Gaiellaceae bacterium]
MSSISRFPVPDLESLPDDLRATIEEVAAKTGFVPNAYLNIAHRPDEWRAFFAYYSALMDGDEGLTKAERELIVVATSAVNDCTYCVVAHGALARLQSKNPIVADQVAVDWRKADLTPRERAIVEFAVKLAETPAEVADEDIERLRAGGLTEDEIWQIGAITAFFAMSNRLAHFTATPPNPEFHLMGRVPRATYEQLVKPDATTR